VDNTSFIQTRQTLTAPGASAAFDVSGVKGDYNVFLRVITLNGRARFAFSDKVGAGTAVAGPAFNVSGGLGAKNANPPSDLGNPNPVVLSFSRKDWPSLNMGTAGATLTLSLAEITGSAPTVTYESWITYQSSGFDAVLVSPYAAIETPPDRPDLSVHTEKPDKDKAEKTHKDDSDNYSAGSKQPASATKAEPPKSEKK